MESVCEGSTSLNLPPSTQAQMVNIHSTVEIVTIIFFLTIYPYWSILEGTAVT